MATEFCQKCKQSHPGRLCDYDDKGECAETIDISDRGETEESVANYETGKEKGHY